ncbi:MAG: ribonucleoside-diphosphate reductase subunit alpha [Dokdonella sp.]|uniref:ribonucleoside-diphosphate reductase subunit alpha n=1 Tax=Dokdonella sp. TaxID=2291710 RepID=UPI0025BF9628|nr:ribonucleoside-diphosphate reductase subunit alpha [Dokdonella sp.]MBX3701344.1 ribonucleoside-diphosphate reductase subunit alpha [Dokdonella sp.]MCW5577226.1 ribonucleoside-diphosphate reductase subunit alpha [Dokdonella sp.]
MQVTKRSGAKEPVDLNKIVRAVTRCCDGLADVDPMRVALKTIAGLYDGATTRELDELSIRTAASFIAEEPEYSKAAARLLAGYIDKEVQGLGIYSFSQSIRLGFDAGLINERVLEFVEANARKLNDAVDAQHTLRFEYFGLRTLYDRYLLKHPTRRQVIETAQQFWMRVACALSDSVPDAIDLYGLFARLDYVPSSPTLFNSGTRHEQLSSCFLLDSPEDSLEAIYDKYRDVALLSKFSGGIGLAYHRVRAEGSLIRSTNGLSNGIVPWLKTLDSSVAAVNQGGKRKGAACVYLESWHADIEAFLELRDNTGDEARRTHHLNIANWVPDLFMRRVEADADWSLFDPRDVPDFPDLWGAAFDSAYAQAEARGLARKQVRARDLYARMMRTLAQTGNGWMTFKDACNRAANQTAKAGHAIHLSNLCTEIIEVTSSGETAVCNLGSINLAQHHDGRAFDFDKLAHTVQVAVRQLDRVIDLNFYPIDSARASNLRWRPVGLGLMGLQDVFFALRLPFDSDAARALSARIAEEIYYWALRTSLELARGKGAHPAFADTRAARGELQFDAWNVTPTDGARWDALRAEIKAHGLRNSLLIAIAPTATIASIAGCYECIEPQVSNLFKRETLSGDFLQVNRYLVDELKRLGLWTAQTRDAIKLAEGSVQSLATLPAELRTIYRTVWETPMRALIDMAADRGAFIDQSQSLNLFIENPNIGQLSSMYMHAWKKGLKTTYYLRSRPATKIAKTTVGAAPAKTYSDSEAVVCSLENPEMCEACQ